ncbi:unnamed protein product [Calypogeia fissa]
MVVRACCILQNFMIQKQENDFTVIMREWELEVAAMAQIEDEGENQAVPQRAEGRHGNLVDEELWGLASTRTLVAYVDTRRPVQGDP